ncbi:MAG: hypothetical protein V1834_02755 [Candidatus Micrarchaeota archaeon]
MGKLSPAVNWFQKNSKKLGKQYKGQWLAIDSKGVKKNSLSFSKLAKQVEGQKLLIVKIPKNPQTAFCY